MDTGKTICPVNRCGGIKISDQNCVKPLFPVGFPVEFSYFRKGLFSFLCKYSQKVSRRSYVNGWLHHGQTDACKYRQHVSYHLISSSGLWQEEPIMQVK